MFTSHKHYSYGLIFSGNPKKVHTDQVSYKFRFTHFGKKQVANLQN